MISASTRFLAQPSEIKPTRNGRFQLFIFNHGKVSVPDGLAILQLRHGAKHELVEQRNGERHVAVSRAVKHTFLYQVGPARPMLLIFTLSASAMSPLRWHPVLIRHRPHKSLFTWRKPVKSDAKKIGVKALNHCCCGFINHLQRDGRTGGTIP